MRALFCLLSMVLVSMSAPAHALSPTARAAIFAKPPLLLDQLPPAPVAYSLHKLRRAYTGPDINIRRASDNAQVDIGFDSQGNMDAGAVAGFCAATTCLVTKWYDQSGNGISASQATAATQPQITLALTPHSKPAIVFGGTQWLESAGTWTSGAPATYAAYAERTGNFAAINNIFGTPGSGSFGTPALDFTGSANRSGLQGQQATLSAAANDSVFHSLIGIANDVSSSLTVDGVTTSGSAASTTTTAGVVTVAAQSGGHNVRLTGSICQIIGFSVGLSAGQISALASIDGGYW